MSAMEQLGLQVFIEGFSQFQSQMNDMDSSIGKTADSWNGLGGIASGAFTSLQTAGKIAISGVVAGATAIGGAMAASLGPTMAFQDAITALTIASGGAGVSMQTLHDAAISVGGDTSLVGVSASSAATSMTDLYKAGLTTSEIFGDLNGYMAGTAELGGALRASIDLAASSELEMGEASQLAAVLLSTFGGEMKTEAERSQFINDAMNNMVKSADASVASVSELQAALQNVGPTASSMGFSLEETNTALAIMSSRGIAGAEAGTNLKSFFSYMTRDVPKVKEALDELNVSLYDEAGAMRSLPDIMGQFEKSLSGLTEQERNEYIATIAGNYGKNAMIALLEEGTEGWNDMEEAIGNATGIAAQSAAKTATLSGVLEALSGVMETLQISIMEPFLPILSEFVSYFSELASTYGPMVAAAMSVVATKIGEIMTGIQNGMEPMEAFKMALSSFLPPEMAKSISEFVTYIQPLADSFIAWTAETFTLSDVLTTIGIAISTVVIPALASFVVAAAPVIAVVGAVMLAVSALRQMWESDWGGIRSAIENFIVAIQPQLNMAWNLFSSIFSDIVEFVMPLVADMASFVEEQVSKITAWIEENLPMIQQIITYFLTGIKVLWDFIWPYLQIIIEGTWNNIKTIVDTAINIVLGIIQAVLQILTGDWEGAWNTLGVLVGDAWVAIQEYINNGIEAAKQFLEQFITDSKTTFEKLPGALGEIAGRAFSEIKTKFEEGARAAGEKIGNMVSEIKGKFSEIDWGAIGQSIIDGIASGIKGAAGALASAAADAANDALDAAKGALGIQSPSKAFAYLGEQSMAGFSLGLQNMTPAIQAQAAAAVAPPALNTVSNNSTVIKNYNLTTQSITRPGALRMEFAAMSTESR